ncbi:hypothetical protein ES708_18211 [subsurface metagenome]
MYEAHLNEPVVVKARPGYDYIVKQNRYLPASQADTYGLNHPENPFITGLAIDWTTMTEAEKKLATVRLREGYHDIIKYINSVEGWCVALKRTGKMNFVSNKRSLPFTDYDSFMIEYGKLGEFHQRANEIIFNRINKKCFGDTIVGFWDGNKLRTLQFEFSTGTKDITLYDIIKQRDFKYGFTKDGTAAIMVVQGPAAKKKFIEMYQSIGIDFPILTVAEYQSFMNAWWYAYAEKCVTKDSNGIYTVDRTQFHFIDFIRGLYQNSAGPGDTVGVGNWNIRQHVAENIMASFGFKRDGNRFSYGEFYKWKPFINSDEYFRYKWYMSDLQWYRFWKFYNDDISQMKTLERLTAWLY